MDDRLNHDTQQKARELARTITVAHDLDPEIQEELYGHIEDKLLAYKSGEERLSDEDAFILVRERFGDAKVLKSLFQEVHGAAVQETLLRRLLVAVMTTLLCVQAVAWLAYASHLLIGYPGLGPWSMDYASLLTVAFACLLPWSFFALWRDSESRGAQVWYTRWRTRWLAAASGALFVAALVVPGQWVILEGVMMMPRIIHQGLSHTILEAGLGRHHTELIVLYLVGGVATIGAIMALVLHKTRPDPNGDPRKWTWIRIACLWSAAASVLLFEAIAIGVAAVLFQLVPKPDIGLHDFARILFDLPKFLCLPLIGLAFCSSWVWWCDAPPRLTKNILKVVGAWSLMLLLYSAMPLLIFEMARRSGVPAGMQGITLLQGKIPGTDIWIVLGREANIRYFLPHLSTSSVFVGLLSTAVAVTFHWLGRIGTKQEVESHG